MSAKKRTRLTGLRMRRVDLVDAGDNPGAEILLAKARDRKVKKSGPLTLGEVVSQNEVGQALSDLYNALCSAVWNNLYGDGTPEEKASNIKTSIAQFAATLTAEVDEEFSEDAALIVDAGDVGAMVTIEYVQKMADAALGRALRVVRKVSGQSLHVPDIDPAFKGKKTMSDKKDDKDKTAAELEKERDTYKAQAEAGAAEVVTLKARVTELEKAAKDASETPEAIEKRKLDALPADVRKRLEDNETEIKKLRDAGELIDFAKAAAELKIAGTTPEAFAPILRDLTKALSAEQVTEVKRILKSASEMASRSAALHALGSPGHAPQEGSALTEIQKRAKSLQEADPKLTFGKAWNKALAEDPARAARLDVERTAAS